ncbi:hypothetical protein GF386_03875 [Candidatus Pacearchaeota archaeon]|nr:hypothetical protein [Candidatus Pacearchaeota archaeon]MBD3283287.1 hypothetical protein [Candidatus Pacearchaeota archaeon]
MGFIKRVGKGVKEKARKAKKFLEDEKNARNFLFNRFYSPLSYDEALGIIAASYSCTVEEAEKKIEDIMDLHGFNRNAATKMVIDQAESNLDAESRKNKKSVKKISK